MADIVRLLAFLNLVTHVSPWTLESTYSNVILQISDDVTLRCVHKKDPKHEAKDEVQIDQITRIRLLKRVDATNDRWNTFAEVAVPDSSQVKLTQPNDAKASGHVGRTEESYLSVTWPMASEDTVGTYMCEADGFVASDRSDFHVNTMTLNITSHAPSTSDLVDLIRDLKRKSDKMSEDMEIMARTHKLATKVLQQEISASQENQTRDILNQVMVKIEEINKMYDSRHWPTGNYSLLATADGCPRSPFRDFHYGIIKIKYESSSVLKHAGSTPSHLKQPFYERNQKTNEITFTYCNMKSPTNGECLPWPEGSYCISPPMSRKCPPKFSLGDVNFYLASSSKREYIVVDPPYFSGDYPTDFSFCCRKDGQPDVPIALPIDRPFYLYRYGGKCQKVRNMDVSGEWVELETDDSQSDRYDFKDIHPDSNLNDLRIFLCYYTKQDH